MVLSDVQAAQAQAATVGYEAARFAGSFAVGGWTFQPTQQQQMDIMGLLVGFMPPATPPATVPLADASGVTRQLTYAQLQTLAQDIALASVAAWNKLQTLLGQIAAATTAEQAQQVQW